MCVCVGAGGGGWGGGMLALELESAAIGRGARRRCHFQRWVLNRLGGTKEMTCRWIDRLGISLVPHLVLWGSPSPEPAFGAGAGAVTSGGCWSRSSGWRPKCWTRGKTR